MLDGWDFALLALAKGGAVAILPLVNRGAGRPPLGDDPQSVLGASERRRRILAEIEERPGAGVRELAARLQIAPSSVELHLQRLIRAGLIETRLVGRTLRLYAGGQAPPEGDAELLTESDQNIARIILKEPGLSSVEITERAGIFRSRVNRQLRSLQQAGFLRSERDGRIIRYYATRRLTQFLEDS